MRASRDASPRLRDIRQILGLDEGTFTRVITSVIASGWAVSKPGDVLALTQQGLDVLEAGQRERAETRVVSVDYDGLLRRPALLNLPIEPQQRRSLGLRELPAQPGTPPDLLELEASFAELQTLIRHSGDGRDQDVELLAVKGILRRERVYREATIVVMRSMAGQIQTAPLVDGVVSNEHERKLAAPALSRQLRVASELRRGRQRQSILPEDLRERFNAAADAEAHALRRSAQNAHVSDDSGTSELRDRARYASRALNVRTVAPQEHLQLVDTVLRSAHSSVVIIVAAITTASIDRDLMAQLERCSERDVTVTVIHEPEYSPPPSLTTAATDWKSLRVATAHGIGRSILVRDDDLALVTLFPLLASVGLERKFRDERGWLVQRPENVRFITTEVTEIFARAEVEGSE
jgi:hypothetical protein